MAFTCSRKLFFFTTIQIKMRPLSTDGATLIFVFLIVSIQSTYRYSLHLNTFLFCIQYVTDDNSDDWTVLVDNFNPKENGNIYDLSGNPIDIAKLRIVPISASEIAEFVTFTADVQICEKCKFNVHFI